MNNIFSEEAYEAMLAQLFVRFPSFQKDGAGAYKPGIGNMEFFDQLAGHPHRGYKVIHVAGTNGKGSVSNMLASALSSCGYKVGLYTSPHIIDFRERMRVISDSGDCQDDSSYRLVSKEYIWNFVNVWKETFDHLDMSFFEITTAMAMSWFADENVDIVVLETGLGGRLDSTNIVSPVLSVITNIGLDHCDMLGETLPEIAFEKAGIIKPGVPVVVGESHPDTDQVFERKVLYTNLSEPKFMGDRNVIMGLLKFADKVEPTLWGGHEAMLSEMDLKGEYQRRNLRTVMAVLDVVRERNIAEISDADVVGAIIRTAARTGFGGRWEALSEDPLVICDIGHNEHGLKYNFSQLDAMKASGRCTHLIMVYGSVADKDVDAVIRLMPEDASYVFTQAVGKRALPADVIMGRYLDFCREAGRQTGPVCSFASVADAVRKALDLAADIRTADPAAVPVIYIGGSTYVVSEAVALLKQAVCVQC